MKLTFLSLLLILLATTATPAAEKLPAAPPMPRRAIAPPATRPVGKEIPLKIDGRPYTLFIPANWNPSRPITLTIHFHGVAWFVVDEHLRRGLSSPLLVADFGQGSAIYRDAFLHRDSFSNLLSAVLSELTKNGAAPTDTPISVVDISSFSAGYGAVREILRYRDNLNVIRRVVLCDSMYASYAAPTPAPKGATRPTSRPAMEHIEPYLAFAALAAEGKKTFVLTHSQVPTTTYANSALCAAALIDRIQAPIIKAPASREEYRLLSRADRGHFHVWSYAGEDAQAHLTHIRHLADVWKSLDDAGAP